MNLGELIEALEAARDAYGSVVMRIGFGSPHSYRGYYEQIAFEPEMNVSLEAVLESVKSAVNTVHTGYKGGEYLMSESTVVNLARFSRCGVEFSQELIDMLLSESNFMTEAE